MSLLCELVCDSHRPQNTFLVFQGLCFVGFFLITFEI